MNSKGERMQPCGTPVQVLITIVATDVEFKKCCCYDGVTHGK